MKVAVVGGGLTGMVSALLLAARGHAVTLIEGQPALGGVARPIDFGGRSFCPGPQYVWGFGEQGPGWDILRAAGLCVRMIAMDESFEHVAVGDGGFRTVQDDVRCGSPFNGALDDALDRLGRAGPVIARGGGFRHSGSSMVQAVATAAELGLADRLEVFYARNESVADLARRYSVDAMRLRRIAYSQGIFAESLADLSAVVFAAARHHLRQTLHVPEGGVAALVQALIDAVSARPGITLRLGCDVLSSSRDAAGHRLTTPVGELGPFDRIVASCSPAVVSRITGRPLAFEPSHTMGAACLAVDLAPAAADALRHRNFTWYDSEHDVAFGAPTAPIATVNFTSPTLNGGAEGGRHVICAYFPASRGADPSLGVDAVRRTAELVGRITPGVEVVDAKVIGSIEWTNDFGAFDGAIYGRRLTSASLQRSALHGLPPGWTLAHSGAGIPGVLGCLQMADAAAREASA